MKITELWSLPESIVKRLGTGVGRQRAIVEEGHILLVLHRVPESGEPDREGVFFWRRADGSWEATGRGGGLSLLRTHVQAYAKVIDEWELRYRSAETSTETFRILEAIGPVNRAAQHLAAALQTAREGVKGDRELIDLRDLAYDVARAAELLWADAKNRLDYEIAEQAEIQAKQGQQLATMGHRLNVLAALFLPITAIASIFGMNFPSGLEDVPHLFWIVLGVGMLLGVTMRALLKRAERC